MTARASAGAFALAAALSLWNGTTEWTAAFRGLAAAVACAVLVPPIYGPVERAWRAAEFAEPAAAAPAAKRGGARP